MRENEFTNAIIVGDTTKILPQLIRDKKQYHVIIADPPYNIGKDFGNNSASMPVDDYVKWAEPWIRDCLHLLTEDGLLYLYGLPEIIARISVRFPINEQRWLVWHYTNKTVPSLKFWQRSHETILCLWKPSTSRPDLEIDPIREPYTDSFLRNAAGKERKNTPSRYGGSGKKTIYQAHENGALPRDVLKIPALAGGAGRAERWFVCKTCDSRIYPPESLAKHRGHDILKHPTQKPMELTRRLIQSRINGTEGKVLIPFAGSGSECVVARALGVEYLGIEMNPEFVDFAKKWLAYDREQQLLWVKEITSVSITPRMQQNLRQYLEKYHDLFDGGRCSGWELEELIYKSIQSDNTAGHHPTWKEGGHDDQAGIHVRVNGEIYPLQIKSGEIKQIKSGDEKKPHLVLSGHRMSRFNGDFNAITEYLNEERADFLSIPYRKVDDSTGRHHIYQIVYVEGMYLRQLNPDQWEKVKSSWRQVNPYGVIFTVSPSMSWQVWWRIPLSLVNCSPEFVIG